MADPGLVDTNVLVYAVFPASPQHAASRALIDQATASSPLYLTTQTLAEFYAVVTDARRVTHPRQPDEAIDAIEQFLALPGMMMLTSPPDLVTRWLTLARQQQVVRGDIFDLLLAASSLGNGISRVYTFNKSDFDTIPGIDVVTP
jgi:toxin-antitoxin system PIN domain toxin